MAHYLIGKKDMILTCTSMTAYALKFEGYISPCLRISPWFVYQIIRSFYWWSLDKALKSSKNIAARAV